MTKKHLIITFLIALPCLLFAQSDSLASMEFRAGLRFQKAQKLYWENGLTFDFTSSKLLDKRLHLGLSYVSSRYGSAINSNAVKQEHFIFSTAYHFRHKKQLHPIVQLNLGYFHANYEEEIFDALPNTAFLTSLEFGLFYEFKFPLSLSLCFGYNFSAGNGIEGPGTLYPFFYQVSFYYTFLK